MATGHDESNGSQVTQDRSGIALALSGGGYRAVLFHTGALIRLNELGLLKQVTRISSVSGGSLPAAYLGLVWPRLTWTEGTATNLREVFVDPMLALSRVTVDAMCGVVGFMTQGRLVSGMLAWMYDRALFHGATLQDLPSDEMGPRVILCSTNLTTGSLWRFSRPYMADWRVGRIDHPTLPLARAVAASSGFPPILSPMRLDLTKYDVRPWPAPQDKAVVPPPMPDYVRRLAILTDGGVYDNHGLEPLDGWPTVLVSDGGAPHAVRSSGFGNWYSQLVRVLRVTDNQVRSLRRRTLIERYGAKELQGAYWSVATNPELYARQGGLDCPLSTAMKLAAVPTRLKDYGDPVRNALVNWGYTISDKAIRGWYRSDLPPASAWPQPGGL